MTSRKPDDPTADRRQGEVQGEGDYKSARRYMKDAESFANSGQVEPAARDAEPRSEAEAKAMKEAEQAGKSRAKP